MDEQTRLEVDNKELRRENKELSDKNYILEKEKENLKNHRAWLVVAIIFLSVLLFAAIVTGGQTTINEGHTLEEVTNATIQTCKALGGGE